MTEEGNEHLLWLTGALYFTVRVGEERLHPNLRPLTDRQLDKIVGDHCEQILAALAWADAHPTFPFQNLKPEMRASASAICDYLRQIRRDLLARKGSPEAAAYHVPSLRQALYYVVHRQITAAEFLSRAPVPRGPDLRPLDDNAMAQVLADRPDRLIAALGWAKDHPEFDFSTLYDGLPSNDDVYEYLCQLLARSEKAGSGLGTTQPRAWSDRRLPR